MFSRAYFHHVVKANEIIASMLLTWHNLTYYQDLMSGLRAAISTGALADYARQCRQDWDAETGMQAD
jgi:queuine tRNA-ribosyltransferase